MKIIESNSDEMRHFVPLFVIIPTISYVCVCVRFFLVFSTFSSGLCSIGLYFVYNKYQNLTVSAIFSGAISCGNAALDCLITEVFPTQLRATGIAISMVAARLGGIIGNIVIAQLLDVYCPAPTFIVAALLIGKCI